MGPLVLKNVLGKMGEPSGQAGGLPGPPGLEDPRLETAVTFF
jgi:hypothetical protein